MSADNAVRALSGGEESTESRPGSAFESRCAASLPLSARTTNEYGTRGAI
jgi:hypothetical protein